MHRSIEAFEALKMTLVENSTIDVNRAFHTHKQACSFSNIIDASKAALVIEKKLFKSKNMF